MPTITPFLWFDTQAQEAMTFYTSIFKDSKVIASNPTSVQFELLGQRFIGLNAGPHHRSRRVAARPRRHVKREYITPVYEDGRRARPVLLLGKLGEGGMSDGVGSSVPEPRPSSINRQPTPTKRPIKTGLKSSISGPLCCLVTAVWGCGAARIPSVSGADAGRTLRSFGTRAHRPGVNVLLDRTRAGWRPAGARAAVCPTPRTVATMGQRSPAEVGRISPTPTILSRTRCSKRLKGSSASSRGE